MVRGPSGTGGVCDAPAERRTRDRAGCRRRRPSGRPLSRAPRRRGDQGRVTGAQCADGADRSRLGAGGSRARGPRPADLEQQLQRAEAGPRPRAEDARRPFDPGPADRAERRVPHELQPPRDPLARDRVRAGARPQPPHRVHEHARLRQRRGAVQRVPVLGPQPLLRRRAGLPDRGSRPAPGDDPVAIARLRVQLPRRAGGPGRAAPSRAEWPRAAHRPLPVRRDGRLPRSVPGPDGRGRARGAASRQPARGRRAARSLPCPRGGPLGCDHRAERRAMDEPRARRRAAGLGARPRARDARGAGREPGPSRGRALCVDSGSDGGSRRLPPAGRGRSGGAGAGRLGSRERPAVAFPALLASRASSVPRSRSRERLPRAVLGDRRAHRSRRPRPRRSQP